MRPTVIFLLVVFLFCACSSGGDDREGSLTETDDDADGDAPPGGDDDDDAVSDDDTDVVPVRCPGRPDMLLVPAGFFIFRYEGERFEEEGLTDEEIYLEGFCIDEFEYPNEIGEYTIEASYDESKDYCESIGKRLCTGHEWQKACAGPEGLLYPWGDEWDDSICNTHTDDGLSRELAPAGSWENCVSFYGVYDMSGNMSEWTADLWQEGWPDRTIRGGGINFNPVNQQLKLEDGFWTFVSYSQRCSSVHHHEPDVQMSDDSVRCCADP